MLPALLAALALTASSPLAVQNKIVTAISEEKVALDFLGKSPVDWSNVRDWAQRSEISLQQAKGFLRDATTLHPGDSATIGKNIDDARHDDSVAVAATRTKNAAKVKAALDSALVANQRAFIPVAQYTEQQSTRRTAEKPV